MYNENNCFEKLLDARNNPCNKCPLVNAVYDLYRRSEEINERIWSGTGMGPRGERGFDSREEYNIINERVRNVEVIRTTLNKAAKLASGTSKTYCSELPYPFESTYPALEKFAKRIMDLYAENPDNPTIQIGYNDMVKAGLITPNGVI